MPLCLKVLLLDFRFTRVAILYGNDTLAVCKACDVSIGEIVNFLDTDREHMQQGLFPDVQRSYVLHSAIAFDEVTITVSGYK